MIKMPGDIGMENFISEVRHASKLDDVSSTKDIRDIRCTKDMEIIIQTYKDEAYKDEAYNDQNI